MELSRFPENKIQGVVLDVDGTLYHHLLVRAAMASRFLRHFPLHPGRTLRAVDIVRKYRRQQEILRKTDCLPGTDDPQLTIIAKETGLDPTIIASVLREWMQQAPLAYVALALRQRLIKRLHSWHGLGVPMAVYSDYPAKEKLQRCGLAFLEEHCLCSTDAAVRSFKPNPRGFLAAAEMLKIPASGLVYLGDRYSVDAAGSVAAGMGYVLLPALGWRSLKDGKKIERVLQKLDRLFALRYGKNPDQR